MTASFGKGVMIRDTLFTCPVLRRVVYLVSGYTHGERFVHPFGEVVINHPIDDGMFCPVTETLSCIGTASIPKAHFGHSVLFWN